MSWDHTELQEEILESLKDSKKCKIELFVDVKNPGKAEKAIYSGSRTHAIHLFCYACTGGVKKDAKTCRHYICPLWKYRPNADTTEIPEGYLPTKEQLAQLKEEKTTLQQRESWKTRTKKAHKEE